MRRLRLRRNPSLPCLAVALRCAEAASKRKEEELGIGRASASVAIALANRLRSLWRKKAVMPPHDGSVATGGYLPFDLVLGAAVKQQHQEHLKHDEEVEEKSTTEEEQQQHQRAEEEEESVAEPAPAADAAAAEPHQQQQQEQPAVGVDDFAPVRAVGNGDMGTVFLVAHKSTRTAYAMKVMKKEVLRQRDTFFRADLERDVLASLDHPFLPSLYAHFETPNHRFLVMNYCAGGDLNVLRQVQPEKRFSEAAARSVTIYPCSLRPFFFCCELRTLFQICFEDPA